MEGKLIFLDSSDPKKIRAALETGALDGVTTNPSQIEKAGFRFLQEAEEVLAKIAEELYPRPISMEVDAHMLTNASAMIYEGRRLRALGKNIVVKIPVEPWPASQEAIEALSKDGIPVNATLIARFEQAVMAARAGAHYVSPFIGRLEDYGHDGILLIRQIAEGFKRYQIDREQTKILAASIRSVCNMQLAWTDGADIVTVPFTVFCAFRNADWNYSEKRQSDTYLTWGKKEFSHPFTEKLLEDFHEARQKILLDANE